MKRSLKQTLSCIFIAIVAALLVLTYALNRFFLQEYYMRRKVHMLELAYDTIDKVVTIANENDETIFDLINEEYGRNVEDSPTIAIFRTLNDRSNIDIVMTDAAGTTMAATSREGEWLATKLRWYLAYRDLRKNSTDTAAAGSSAYNNTNANTNGGSAGTEGGQNSTGQNGGFNDAANVVGGLFGDGPSADSIPDRVMNRLKSSSLAENLRDPDEETPIREISTNDRYTTQVFYDRRSGTSYLECWGTFSDQKTNFLMSMPLASIDEGVTVSNRFNLLAGFCMLLVGAVAVYFASSFMTRPINELAQISRRMSELDFGARYEGHAQNEIGLLGASMNSMSDRLEETIGELQSANAKLQETNARLNDANAQLEDANAQLAEANTRLQEANVLLQEDIDQKEKIDEMRKEFIADVSHELKTPIALIEGYAEGLMEGIAEDKESRDYYCSVIVDESAKMNKMVRQLTSLISYEFGGGGLEKSVFDLSELIRSLVAANRLKLEEAGAHLEQHLIPGTLVDADEFKIEEVFTNYMSNAIHHIAGKKKIIVSMEADGETCTVTVYNEGKPIPEESLPHVWEKFYKVDKARTRAYGGSGIGLSIVKAIMEAHGGGYGVYNLPAGEELPASAAFSDHAASFGNEGIAEAKIAEGIAGSTRNQEALAEGVAFWFSLPVAKPDT